MAARTAVFIEAHGLGPPIPTDGPLHIEIWRVDTFTAGDTVTAITPKRGRFIAACIGAPSNLSTAGGNTNVTITLAGPSDVELWVAE